VGGERLVQQLAGGAHPEGGGQLGGEGGRRDPVAVGGERREVHQVQQGAGGGLRRLPVALLQPRHRLEVPPRRRVVREQGAQPLQQLRAPALLAAELPQLAELDVGGVRLVDLPCQRGRLLDQRLDLVQPAGQQRLHRLARARGVAPSWLPQGAGEPQELGQLGLERGVGQFQQVGHPQEPGLGDQLQVPELLGQLGDLHRQGEPVGRVARPPHGVVLREQAGGQGRPVAGSQGGRDRGVGELGRAGHVGAVPGQLPCQAGQQPGSQGRVLLAERGARLLQCRQ
jgi:hypothetical protein